MPIPVAARSKRMWVCGRSLAGSAGLNSAGDVDVCLSHVSVVCYEIVVSTSRRSLVQRRPADCGVSECDGEFSLMRRPWLTRGCCSMENKALLLPRHSCKAKSIIALVSSLLRV
jgi:hypothetical protein